MTLPSTAARLPSERCQSGKDSIRGLLGNRRKEDNRKDPQALSGGCSATGAASVEDAAVLDAATAMPGSGSGRGTSTTSGKRRALAAATPGIPGGKARVMAPKTSSIGMIARLGKMACKCCNVGRVF